MNILKSIRVQFYCLWFVIALVQANATELFDDEAYYWVYARFLDWGYFDHPPMIALMIKWGSFIFSGELGVRLFVVFMGTASIYVIERITRPEDVKLFYAIVLQVAILHIGNSIAAPDIPLFFFTALFFLLYKSFSERPSWINSICLAITIAMLLYSKYHGLLVIIATVLSNWRLLQKPTTWLVIGVSVLLYSPHVLWQLEHGLPSLYYHLFERLSPPYTFSFTTDYLLGQLLIAGPLIGVLLIWGALKYKAIDLSQKAMKWSLGLFYGLFFIASFKTRTEVNWTVPLLVPLIVLGYQYIVLNERLKQWVYRLLPVSLVLILVVRVFMILDTPLIQNLPKDEFHYNKEWTRAVKEKANGLPVVFTNSYQRASKYWFYTGDTAFSLNTHLFRRSNYNLWPLEMQLQNKNVFIVGSKGTAGLKQDLVSGNKALSTDTIHQFSSYSQIVLSQSSVSFDQTSRTITATLEADAPSANILDYAFGRQPEIVLIVYPGNKQQPILVNTGIHLIHSSPARIVVKVELPVLKGSNYQYRWGLKGSFIEPSINSRVYKLINE